MRWDRAGKRRVTRDADLPEVGHDHRHANGVVDRMRGTRTSARSVVDDDDDDDDDAVTVREDVTAAWRASSRAIIVNRASVGH